MAFDVKGIVLDVGISVHRSYDLFESLASQPDVSRQSGPTTAEKPGVPGSRAGQPCRLPVKVVPARTDHCTSGKSVAFKVRVHSTVLSREGVPLSCVAAPGSGQGAPPPDTHTRGPNPATPASALRSATALRRSPQPCESERCGSCPLMRRRFCSLTPVSPPPFNTMAVSDFSTILLLGGEKNLRAKK